MVARTRASIAQGTEELVLLRLETGSVVLEGPTQPWVNVPTDLVAATPCSAPVVPLQCMQRGWPGPQRYKYAGGWAARAHPAGLATL
jgi:hypothetical protein